MGTYRYDGEGTGEIAGVGLVYPGRVVEASDEVAAEHPEFTETTDPVTSDAEVRAEVSRVVVDDEVLDLSGNEPVDEGPVPASLAPLEPEPVVDAAPDALPDDEATASDGGVI